MALKPIRKHFKKSGSLRKDSRRWKSKTSTFIGASGGVIDTYIYNNQPTDSVENTSTVLKIGTDWDDGAELLNYYRPVLHFDMGVTGATLGDLPENTTINKAELTLTVLNAPFRETKCEVGLVPPETLVDSCNWSHYAHGSTASNTTYNWIGDDSTDLITVAGHDVYANLPNATILYEDTIPHIESRIAYAKSCAEFVNNNLWIYSGTLHPEEQIYTDFADYEGGPIPNGIWLLSCQILHSGNENGGYSYAYPGMFQLVSYKWSDTEWPLKADRMRSCFLEYWGYDTNNLQDGDRLVVKIYNDHLGAGSNGQKVAEYKIPISDCAWETYAGSASGNDKETFYVPGPSLYKWSHNSVQESIISGPGYEQIPGVAGQPWPETEEQARTQWGIRVYCEVVFEYAKRAVWLHGRLDGLNQGDGTFPYIEGNTDGEINVLYRTSTQDSQINNDGSLYQNLSYWAQEPVYEWSGIRWMEFQGNTNNDYGSLRIIMNEGFDEADYGGDIDATKEAVQRMFFEQMGYDYNVIFDNPDTYYLKVKINDAGNDTTYEYTSPLSWVHNNGSTKIKPVVTKDSTSGGEGYNRLDWTGSLWTPRINQSSPWDGEDIHQLWGDMPTYQISIIDTTEEEEEEYDHTTDNVLAIKSFDEGLMSGRDALTEADFVPFVLTPSNYPGDKITIDVTKLAQRAYSLYGGDLKMILREQFWPNTERDEEGSMFIYGPNAPLNTFMATTPNAAVGLIGKLNYIDDDVSSYSVINSVAVGSAGKMRISSTYGFLRFHVDYSFDHHTPQHLDIPSVDFYIHAMYIGHFDTPEDLDGMRIKIVVGEHSGWANEPQEIKTRKFLEAHGYDPDNLTGDDKIELIVQPVNQGMLGDGVTFVTQHH